MGSSSEFLIKRGKNFSNQEANSILVKTARGQALGFLGGSADPEEDGRENWEKFQENRISDMNNAELELEVKKGNPFDRLAWFELCTRNFKKHAEFLRAAVDNKFLNEFESDIKNIDENIGADEKLIERAKNIGKFVRQQYMRKAVNILERRREDADVERVKSILKDEFIQPTEADIEYLGLVGEWDDIPLIIKLLENLTSNGLFLLSRRINDSKYLVASKAIYKLGKERLEDILSITLPEQLLRRIIIDSSDKAFRHLSNEILTDLFNSKHPRVRKAAAVKSIKAIPKNRLKELLAISLAKKTHYYNVIYWLDFGISIKQEITRESSSNVLASL